MTEPALIRGLWCATLTPLGRDGNVDHARLASHVQRLLAKGVDGVVPFGTTGEGPSFSVAERCEALDALLTADVSPNRLLAATGAAAFADTLALTRHALESGCPRCLILPPFFWKPLTDEALFRYYASLIDAVGDARLRVYLYHIPQLSAAPIRPEVVVRLSTNYPGIIAGVKDSSGDFEHTAQLLERAPELSILVGHEPHLVRLMRAGGAGTICGIANLFPELIAALLKPDTTADDESRVRTFLDIVLRYPFVPAFKAIRAAQTRDSAWLVPRPPLLPLTDDERATLISALRSAGFDITPEAERW
ncbi:dihydrodipicolinate synthase family protein [Methylocaldum szegediense]|uniref:4-hydroxy-tetrahydrodipicolinate synthase n=1 Tax=Methylocaldum szegediense TaxID=73780 RepID=A0ABN8X4Q6_9GAMM|nr:dihydrodipicolinate synthase family protein [Methylocaldum szegediense]CAI8874339.1 4-hydroxy-tetrahydrodipicolinate synthase [Methylocaldum szegediense]